MRHKKAYRKLGKPTDQRLAMLKSITMGLFLNGKVKTSKARAQEARFFVEKIVALAKKGDLSSVKKALSIIPNKTIIKEVFATAPERFKDNPGGVTRITKTGSRRGDNAKMVLLELI
jgi:large subunit ribosomal protein L17